MSGDGVSFRNVGRTNEGRIKQFLAVGCLLIFFSLLFHLSVEALPIGVYHNHANDENKIALTFDDGPHPRYTIEILNILEEYNVPATFFFVGENVSYYPDAARKVVEKGHEVGNHTFSHPCVKKQGEEAFRQELVKSEEVIQKVTGKRPILFRPPQGSWNTQVYEIAREKGYSVILWDIDTLDWAHTPSNKISEYVVSNAKSGNIILMHDYHSGGCTTTDALRSFIPKLLERGFRFVTVSELIGS